MTGRIVRHDGAGDDITILCLKSDFAQFASLAAAEEADYVRSGAIDGSFSEKIHERNLKVALNAGQLVVLPTVPDPAQDAVYLSVGPLDTMHFASAGIVVGEHSEIYQEPDKSLDSHDAQVKSLLTVQFNRGALTGQTRAVELYIPANLTIREGVPIEFDSLTCRGNRIDSAWGTKWSLG